MRNAAVAVLLGVAAAACASRGDVETMGDALRDDIASLAEGQLRLVEAVQADLESFESSSERRETTGRGELERLLGRLEGLFEQLIEMSAQNNQLLNDIYEHQRRQGSPSPLGFPGPAGAGPPAAGPVAAESNPDASAGSGSDEASQFYALALDMYQRGNLQTARDAFRDFIAVYGSHEFAPDAQYWVARTYEDAEDPGGALEEYRRLTELYPDSSRAPAALFRRAMIEAGRGNTAVARRLFAQIESGYPNSPEAPEARREREKLGG